MILLSPRFNDFKNIEYKDGRIYLTLVTRTLYRQTLVNLFSSWTPVGPKRPPTAPRAETIVKSPQSESMNETYINALISMKIESMQDLQTNNTKQINSMLAIIDQMTYGHRTQSTQIEQLKATAKEQARQIETSNQMIGDQK